MIHPNQSFALRVRMRRLYRHAPQRLLVVPMDHSVTDGPVASPGKFDELVGQLARNHVDAVVLHKGGVRFVSPHYFTQTSLIIHLSASTRHAPDPDAKYLVASVEEAVRLGADAVSVHVNLGSSDERQQVSDMALVGEACDRWNIPLLVMIYLRGPRIEDPHDPELIRHAVVLACDLGADIVKTPYAQGVQEMTEVVRTSPIPLIVAGGAPMDEPAAVLSYVDEVMRAGAAGVAMGRNIFQAPNPGAMARRVADVIHADTVPNPVRELARVDTSSAN